MGKKKKSKIDTVNFQVSIISNGFMVYRDIEYDDYDIENNRVKTYCETKEEVAAFISNLIEETL